MPDNTRARDRMATPPHRRPPAPLFGVAIDPLGFDDVLTAVLTRPDDAPFGYIVTPNAQHIVLLDRGDAAFRAAYDDAWLRLCDSQVIRLLALVLFGRSLPLASGSDLTVRLINEVIHPGDPITIIGGNDVLIQRLRDKFGWQVINNHQPPMGYGHDPAAVAACARFVVAHPARYVFFITGSPQSEKTAWATFQTGQARGVGFCVGSSLNFAVGISRRAPHWMRRYGLEWLYRLLRNPRGHFRRVFIESAPLLWIAVQQRLSRRRPPADREAPPVSK